MLQLPTLRRLRAAARTLRVLLAIALAVALPTLAVAGTPEQPDIIYVPDPTIAPPPEVQRAAGYAWDELENHLHVVETVSDPVGTTRSLVVLTDLPGWTKDIEALDVEVTGLPTNLPGSILYTLDGSGADGTPYHFENPVGPDGKAVFWGIPPVPMTLTLASPDGEAIKTIVFSWGLCDTVMVCVELGSSSTASSTSGGGSSGSGGEPPTNPNPPPPRCFEPCGGYQIADGETLNQGAIANNVYGKVTATGCYKHQMSVSATVSGGAAARGNAGGTFTYTKERCDTISTADWGTQSIREDHFEKATYSDGSYRVYGKGYGDTIRVKPWYVTAVCAGGGTGCFETIITEGCRDFSRTVTEAGSGTATVSGGYSVPLWSVSGSLSVGAQASSVVRYDITHPDCNEHKWYLGALAGNHGSTGLIGILLHA